MIIELPKHYAAALLLFALACDSGSSPVAPDVEGVLFTLSASPTAIAADGSSVVTVVVLEPDGIPVREGTEVLFRTDLGRIDRLARTDERGIAQAILVADGRSGTATVTASSGAHSAAVEIVVGAAPEAAFTCLGSGLEVIFSDATEGDPTSWEWHFGDGASSREKDPVHRYRSGGTYRVELTVRDAGGEDRVSRFVTVPGSGDVCDVTIEPPVADFHCTISGRTVIFTDASGGPPERWRWEFGDGRGSTEAEPVHTYSADGTYRVTLTVRNAAGEDSLSRFVPVAAGTTGSC